MNRDGETVLLLECGKPHVRGDEPIAPVDKAEEDSVSPTCVGMNHQHHAAYDNRPRKPHVRGDEPDRKRVVDIEKIVSPTCVGMNRHNHGR